MPNLAVELLSVAGVQMLVGWWLKTRLEKSVEHEYDRRLEQFKSRETLAIEVAKLRVTVLAEAWRRIAEFEAQCWKQSQDVAQHLLRAAKDSGTPGIPDVLPTGHLETFALLARIVVVDIPDARIAQLQADAAPEQARLLAVADDLTSYLAANRFWIGAEIDEELRDYAQSVRDAFAALGPGEIERREFARLLHLVVDKRWDARTLVARLHADEKPMERHK
jgi:hypothetical protein